MENRETFDDENYDLQQEQYNISTVSTSNEAHWKGPNEKAQGKCYEYIWAYNRKLLLNI